MTILYATLIISYGLSLVIQMAEKANKMILKYLYICLLISLIIFIAGTQVNIGDTPVYINIFNTAVKNTNDIGYEYDGGFVLFVKILTMFTHNPQILIFTSSLIIGLFNILYFLKHRSLLDLEIFLYITTGYYLVTMNGLRQCIVAAIIVWLTRDIHERNFIKYCCIVILISSIHQSALIMIPLYFIIILKPWSKKVFILIFLSMFGIIFFQQLVPNLFSFLEGTNYAHYEDIILSNDSGANILRVLIAAVPVVLAYVKKDFLSKEWNLSYMYVNISVLNFIFYIFTIYSWIFARFTIYFQVYNIILLSFIVKKCFNGKERRLMYFLLCFFYFLAFYLEYDVFMKLEYISYYDWNLIFY